MSDITSPSDAGMGTVKRTARNYATYVFFVMFSINLLNYMDRYVFVGAADTISHELGFGTAEIGFLASAFLVVYTLGTLPLGIWADRTRRKDVVAICVAIWSLATALTVFAGNFVALFISRMVLGIGEAGYYPAGTALLSDYFNRSRRARIMSWWTAGALIGLMIGFIVGGIVAGLGFGKWRLAFLFTGIPGLFLAFLSWRLREPRHNQADEEAIELDPHSLVNEVEVEDPPHTLVVPKDIRSQFGLLLRIKTLVVLIGMQVFAFFVLGANVVYLPTYLQQRDTYNLSSGQAGIFSGAVIVIAGIAGLLIGGYLSDALSRRYPGARVLVCGFGFLLGAPAFVLAITTNNLIIFTIFFIITVLLLNVYNGPSTAATQDVVPAVLRASAVAVSLLFAHLLGDAFAPALIGVIAGSFDPTGAHFAQHATGQDLGRALLITCPVALVISGLIGIFGSRWMKGDVAAAQDADKSVQVTA